MRRAIRHNQETRAPASHVVVDCETTPAEDRNSPSRHYHRLNLGIARSFRYERGTISRWDEIVFRDHAAFWNWLLSKMDAKRPLWLWAHNLGFDLTTLRFWELLENGTFSLSLLADGKQKVAGLGKQREKKGGVLVSEDPPTIVRCWDKTGRTLWAVDSLNWCLCPLQELGNAVGLAKLPMPGEVASDSDWETYCRRDVEILGRVVTGILDFVTVNDLGNFRCTIASQSMHAYRHRCQTCSVVIDTREDIKALERDSYFAPKCFPHFAGCVCKPGVSALRELAGIPRGLPILEKAPVYTLDLRSAYASSMHHNFFPVSYLRAVTDWPVERVREHLTCFAGVASVLLDTEQEAYPAKQDGETWWFSGRFATTLCGPELLRAIDDKQVKRVYKAQFYARDEPFTSFVDLMWGIRQEAKAKGNQLHERLAKGLLAALHGKFGQRLPRWDLLPGQLASQEWGIYHHDLGPGEGLQVRRAVAGNVEVYLGKGESPDSFPLIAAYTVAYHRERMRQLIQIAGYRNTFYQSADSLHVGQQGYENLVRAGEVDSDGLGKLKVERCDDIAYYRGPKDYSTGDKTVLVGVGKKAYQDEKGLWHQTEFDGLESALSGKPPEGPVSTERTITRPQPMLRGRVSEDGWVYPIHKR